MPDASGTPTSPDNIPTYNTALDPPSGKGFNTAMAQIQTIITELKAGTLPSGKIAVAGISATGTPSSTTFLRGDATWATPSGVGTNLGLTVSGANTDVAAPTGAVDYATITTGGGSIRSIGAGSAAGAILTLKNGTASSFVRLLHATAGGTGAQLSIINAGNKFLAPGQSIQFVYDGTNWQEINRPSMELIADLTMGGATATYDTDTVLGVASSIPQVYNELRIVVFARGDAVATSVSNTIRLNNDSAANYDLITLSGNNGAVSSGDSVGTTALSMGDIAAASATAGLASHAIIDLPQYANTNFQKTMISTNYLKRGTALGDQFNRQYFGAWRSSAAITRIALIPGSGNWNTNSRFTLYGIT